MDVFLCVPCASFAVKSFFYRKGRKEDAKFAKKKTSHLFPCMVYSLAYATGSVNIEICEHVFLYAPCALCG